MATTAFGSLSAPAPEDTMEMSSPANRNLDDDIDIDFDDYPTGEQTMYDERMLEDGDHTRPTTATDEMMEDDVPGEPHQVGEEIMSDDVPPMQEAEQPEDEELIDYGDEDFHDEHVDNTAIPAITEVAEVTEIEDPSFVIAGEDISAPNEHAAVEEPQAAIPEVFTTDVVQIQEPAAVAEDVESRELPPEQEIGTEEGLVFTGELETHEDPEHAIVDDEHLEISHEDDVPQHPPPLNTSVSTSADTPGTPTDTGLHPMTIRYGDHVVPLFKSQRQPEGLLKDDNLASLSLAELITNCRQRLGLKIGEDISEDQEIVLGFETMGLVLVEDCRAAFESSLNDVLEVYLQLHQNDGPEDIPALALNITLQLKFQSSFAILKQAAAGGKGMSSFGFLQRTGDQEEFYHDEYEDSGVPGPHVDYNAEDGYDAGHEYAEQPHGQNDESSAEGEHQDHLQDPGEQDAEGYEEYYQEGEYQEDFGEQGFYIPDQDEAAARLNELDAGDAQDEIQTAVQPEDPGATADESNATEHRAPSTASSNTVQGDSANDTAGEYDDEDIIDWDDDSLTPIFSEPIVDGDDFSTFLTEFEEEYSKENGPQDDAVPQDAVPSGKQLALETGADALRSKDFPHDASGQDDGLGAFEGDQHYDQEDAAGEEVENEEEYTFDQADTYDQQHEEYHPDYQPGDEEDQYHTAQDFLNVDDYEHGLEHQIVDEDGEGGDDTVETVIHHETGEYEEFDDQEDYGDEIGYDQDDDGQAQPEIAATISGKRSFDDLEDEFEQDERDVKKVRPS